MSVSFRKLFPLTKSVSSNATFIVDKLTNLNGRDVRGTYKIPLKTVVFDEDSVSFFPTITAHSTQIQFLSSEADRIGTYASNQINSKKTYIEVKLEEAYHSLQHHIYPIGSIKLTTTPDDNPQQYMRNTVWELTGNGYFFAGVGLVTENSKSPYTVGDKNKDIISVGPGPDQNNITGTFNHTVTIDEMAEHNHTIAHIQGSNITTHGDFVESAAKRDIDPMKPQETEIVGGGQKHNNTPPFYGVYAWVRTV